jgi:hypothetical protein
MGLSCLPAYLAVCALLVTLLGHPATGAGDSHRGKEAALAAFASGAPSSATTAVVVCATSVGELTVDVKGHWSPRGAQRFLDMVDAHW